MEKIIKIIYTYILNSLFNKKEESFMLPKTIKGYSFIKDLQSHKKELFRVGLYGKKGGEKVVIKIWKGKIPNAHYYNLRHEISIYKIFSKYNKKSAVSFPEYIYSDENKNEIVLITKYFDGIPIKNITDSSKQLAIYAKCIKFINLLDENISTADKVGVRVRSAKAYLLLYPFIFIAACIQNPNMINTHFRGLKLFLKYLYLFRKKVSLKLIHGDLHQKNILIKNSKIVIIDLEQMMFTYPEFELATILGSKHNSFKFSKEILKQSNKIFSSNINRKGFFTLMAIFCMTYNFTEKLNKENVSGYKKPLDLVFSLNKRERNVTNLLDAFPKEPARS